MSALPVSLEDKYTLPSGRIFLNGTQALVRLAMMQRERDLAAGLNTAGFISGYRGSPLGGFDQALWKAKKHLEQHHIHFTPGVNEELAATAVWGSQQVGLFAGAKYDGVFAMWYGKGPGVDRSGDVFKHANAAGTSKHGGVLLVAGDDHACKSSTLPHQSEHAFDAAMIPVLYPTGVQDILELGQHGFAMSRYSGLYVAFKCVSDTVDASASIRVDPDSPKILIPDDVALPAAGVSIRWPDTPMEQELRLQHDKIYAALAYCRANRLNRITIDAPNPRLGIIASGKSYLDVMQALEDLGIDERHAAEIGIRLYKVGMPWPLEPNGVREFALGLDEILVVEEKRQLIEYQMKEQLYNWRDDVRPRVIGKYDEHGEWEVHRSEWLLPAAGELTPAMIARVIAARIGKFYTSKIVEARLKFLEAKEAALARPREKVLRIPYFCSGCPHNTSTRVPEGSQALAGIGCHYMAIWIRPEQTMTFTQMGGEGRAMDRHPAVHGNEAHLRQPRRRHLLPLRPAGGACRRGRRRQHHLQDPLQRRGRHDRRAARGRQAERADDHAAGARRRREEDHHRHRRAGEVRQRDRAGAGHHRPPSRRARPGAARVARDSPAARCWCTTRPARRKSAAAASAAPSPIRRSASSSTMRCAKAAATAARSRTASRSMPVETEFGRKRAIDQSSCNKDFSCVKGFCPSFVTVEGGQLRKRKAVVQEVMAALPDPGLPALDKPWGILVTGVGGTGVVTIGALLGMAGHIEGKGVAVLDMTGLAQKGGSVYTHVRIAARPEEIHAVRIAAGEADAVLGCDMVVTASDEAIAKMQAGHTRAIVNSNVATTGEFTEQPRPAHPREGDAGVHRRRDGAKARRNSSTRRGWPPPSWETRSTPTPS